MTAITLNLLAEEQSAEQAQARDPFRITLFTGISMVVLMSIAGVFVTRAASAKKLELAALQAKRDGLFSNQGSYGNGDTKSLKGVADDLIAMNRTRTLYAQQLALIKDLVPTSIQLMRVNFKLIVESADAAMPTDAPIEGDATPTKAARHKPKSTERLSLQLDGKAISSRPEIEIDQFIKSLRTNPTLSNQVKDIKLRSIARSVAAVDAASATTPSSSFVIECQYKEHR